MTLNIPLSPEAVEKLRERAQSEGKDIETFVRDVLAEKLASGYGDSKSSGDSPVEWQTRMDDWIASFPRVEETVDDSRESIYSGRDE